jgi:glycine/D-amino acid oxidase-like deaminating enzyme
MTVQSVGPDFPRLGAGRSWSSIWERGFDYITQSPGPDGSLYLGGGLLQLPGNLAEQALDLGCSNDAELSAACSRQLETAASRSFANAEDVKIVRKWTGIMGCTGDGLPLIDRLSEEWTGREDCDPKAGGEWICAGFNGFGMVNCWLSGKAMAHFVTGRGKEVESWFPVDEYACRKERLDQMTAEGSLDGFLHHLDT